MKRVELPYRKKKDLCGKFIVSECFASEPCSIRADTHELQRSSHTDFPTLWEAGVGGLEKSTASEDHWEYRFRTYDWRI